MGLGAQGADEQAWLEAGDSVMGDLEQEEEDVGGRQRAQSDSIIEYGYAKLVSAFCEEPDAADDLSSRATSAGEELQLPRTPDEEAKSAASDSDLRDGPSVDWSPAPSSPASSPYDNSFASAWMPDLKSLGLPVMSQQDGGVYCIGTLVPMSPDGSPMWGSMMGQDYPRDDLHARAAELEIAAAQMKAAARQADVAARHARIKAEAPWRRAQQEPQDAAAAQGGQLPQGSPWGACWMPTGWVPCAGGGCAQGFQEDPACPSRPPQRDLAAAKPAKQPRQKRASEGDAASSSMSEEERTTIMLRNLPNDYNRDALLELLDEQGFAGRYDFCYLPVDFQRWAGFGYAFVNMLTHEDAVRCREHFQGFSNWKVGSLKVCDVCWGEPLQGLADHCARYRNSPVMHPDVPDEFKPALFEDGLRIDFPLPTKRIRPPRTKRPCGPRVLAQQASARVR